MKRAATGRKGARGDDGPVPPRIVVTDGRERAALLAYFPTVHDAPRLRGKAVTPFDTHMLISQAKREGIVLVRDSGLARRLTDAVSERHRIPETLYKPVARAFSRAADTANAISRRILARARPHLDAGNHVRGLRILMAESRRVPHCPFLRYNISTAHWHLGHRKEAEQALAAAARVHHGNASLHMAIAAAYRELDRPCAVRKALLRAVKAAPDHAEARQKLADSAYGLNRLKEAVRHAWRAVRLRPDDEHAWFLLGTALCRKKRFRGGTRALAKAAALRPGEPASRYNLGIAYLEARDPARAADTFLEAVRLSPTNVVALAYAALTCAMAGRTTAATSHLVEAERIDAGTDSDAGRIMQRAKRILRRVPRNRLPTA